MKVSDFAEITKAKSGNGRVLKYYIFNKELLNAYFEECRHKPSILAKRLRIHYQSTRKLLQSADLWKHVSTINRKGSGDNLRRKVMKNQAGYKYSEDPDDYRISYENGKRRSRRKLEHIAVIERYLGRTLRANEVVHHIDGDKLNNSLKNLYVCSRSEHSRLHKELEALALNLVKKGYITFQNGTYILK